MPDATRPAGSATPLGDRYGRVLAPAQRRRRLVLVAVLTAAIGLVATAWVGAAVLRVPVRTQDAGFHVVDDAAVDVTFVVVKDPGAVARCRVRALSPGFAEVGARDVVVGASAYRSVQVTTRVATSERATTGMVQSCRVASEP